MKFQHVLTVLLIFLLAVKKNYTLSPKVNHESITADEDKDSLRKETNTTEDSPANEDDIDARLDECLIICGNELKKMLTLLHDFVEKCLDEHEEEIDLNSFWEYAEN